jgi:hypothetical protein
LRASGIFHEIVPSTDYDSAANRPFVTAFMEGVPRTDRASLMQPDGSLSTAGIRRIRNAVLASAYDDPHTISRMSESTDDNVRGVGAAMGNVAPALSALKQGIADGSRYPNLDITNDISDAANTLSHLRDTKRSVPEHLAQTDMFGDGMTPIAQELLSLFDRYKRRPAMISGILSKYAEGAGLAGDPRQGDLFGGGAPSPDSILKGAVTYVEKHEAANAAGAGQPSLALETAPESAARANNLGAAGEAARQAPPRPAASAIKNQTAQHSAYSGAYKDYLNGEGGNPSPKSFGIGDKDAAVLRYEAEHSLAAQLRAKAEEVKADIADSLKGQLFSGIDPVLLGKLAQYGALKISEGAVNFAEWSKEMISEFGDAIKPHLRTVYDAALRVHAKYATGQKPTAADLPTLGEKSESVAPPRTLGDHGIGLTHAGGDIADKARLKAVSEATQDSIETQRRGVRTWAQTRQAAKELNADYEQYRLIKPGHAFNAEELTQLRNLRNSYQSAAKAARIQAKYDPSETNQKLADDLTAKETHLVQIEHGGGAESARALQSMGMDAKADRPVTPTSEDIFHTRPNEMPPRPAGRPGRTQVNRFERNKIVPADRMAEIKAKYANPKNPCPIG